MHGYEAVCMEQIADAADVAKATLYNYFPVKEALIGHRFREDTATGMADRAHDVRRTCAICCWNPRDHPKP